MGALLGPVGELREIKCAADLSVADATPRGTALQALSGRVYFQHAPRPRRVWGVGIGTATPEEAFTLAHLAARRGDVSRPLWFLSEEARTANILTPQISMMEDGHRVNGTRATVSATMFAAADGHRPLSVVAGSGAETITLAPTATDVTTAIPHNTVFTASAYMTRPTGVTDCSLRVQEIDQSGTVIHTHYSVVPTDVALQRRVITATTKATTVAIRVQAFKPLAVADPAVTLTDKVMPYALGLGASRVVIEDLSHSVQRATTDVWDRRSSWAYQVREIG